MKKILISILVVVLFFISYLIYDDIFYSPIDKKEFKHLFNNDNIHFSKICSDNFIGTSIHGEIFDIYGYKIKGVSIDKRYPLFNEWENNKITNTTIIGKWKSCPIDSLTATLFESSIFNSKNFISGKCSASIKNDIIKTSNYYSYIYISDSEKYFFLYCTDREEFFYVRLKGL